MANYELRREDGELAVKLVLSDEDRAEIAEAVKLLDQFATDDRQLNIILTPARKEMLGKVLAVVRAVI